jgi:hypothetical protein
LKQIIRKEKSTGKKSPHIQKKVLKISREKKMLVGFEKNEMSPVFQGI